MFTIKVYFGSANWIEIILQAIKEINNKAKFVKNCVKKIYNIAKIIILKYEWFSENKSFIKLDFIFIDFVTLFRTPLVYFA